MKKGIFITFEGTEGAGKSTLIRALVPHFESRNRKVTTTREPGGSPIAEKIRNLILEEKMDAWTEAFLYEASRAEHLARTLGPALEAGHVVLCDRYTDSTLAYQGHARGLDWKTLKKLNTIATQGLKPHLTIWVDIDPGTGLKHATDPNRFEREGTAFQARVRRGFLRAKREDPRRFIVVRARSGSPEEMARLLFEKILKKIRKI